MEPGAADRPAGTDVVTGELALPSRSLSRSGAPWGDGVNDVPVISRGLDIDTGPQPRSYPSRRGRSR